MATGSPAEPGSVAAAAEVLVALAGRRRATPGGGRVICLDGPAGSGKTTLGGEVARLTGADVVHMDDLMHGWDAGFDTLDALAGVVAPWADGEPGSYRRYDWGWVAGRLAETVPVPPAAWLVVEGVGSGRTALAAATTVLAWVEAPPELRLTRGLARDGVELEPRWLAWMAGEAGLFAAERTRQRADVLVDGTGRRPPVVR